jgi:hypothetical protein
MKNRNDLMENQTRDLRACSTVLQSTTLPLTSEHCISLQSDIISVNKRNHWKLCVKIKINTQ